LQDELNQQEAALERAIARLSVERPRERVADLELASEAWRVYRALECRTWAMVHQGGSIAPVAELACKVELTKIRAEVLQARYGAGAEDDGSD
jgi:uncharacterized protein YecT (DUF1311 family)